MEFRKARFSDVEQIHKLVNDYAAEGLMLARARNVLYETLREFILAEDDGKIVGVGALHLIWDSLAEVRTMAVAPTYKGQGVGRQIVEQLLEEGRESLGIVTQIFALTYQPGFFAKLGFHEVPKRAAA